SDRAVGSSGWTGARSRSGDRTPGSALQHPKLYAKGRHAGARHLGQAPIPWIAGHREQLRDASAADPCDDPELRHMGTDRVDHAGLLANEEMACPVEHEAGLLLRRLGLHEAHVRENIVPRTVEALGPHMPAGRGIDKL